LRKNRLIAFLQSVLDISDTELQIYKYIAENSYATIKDIVSNLKLSRQTVHEKLNKLINLGLVEKLPGKRGYIYKAKGGKHLILKLLKEQLEKIYREFEEEFSNF